MKLCFSTLGCADRTLDEIIALADRYGIKYIEFRGVDGVIDNTQIEDFSVRAAENTKRALSASGMTPIVLGSSCYFQDEESCERYIAEGKANIEIAEGLGIPYVRVFGDRIKDKKTTERVISALTQLCEHAENTIVLLETHGDFNSVQTLAPIVESMNGRENFGLLWDIEHTHKVYGRNWEEFYDFARPYVCHVHIKDYSNSAKALSNIGRGDVPIREIADRLVRDGYTGCFSLEWEKKWHPELASIEIALDDFVRVMECEV